MKRIIFIVCFLLISLITPGCGPEALPSPTITPTATVTSIPPTQTLIPPLPTASPEPEMFQIRSGGVVQEYQGGQYVDILVPNNIWGKTPEGVRVVIKDNWPVLEMDLNNFQDPNGAKSINIAKYNPDTKSWTLLPFSMTREVLDEKNMYERNGILTTVNVFPSNVDATSSGLSLLGIRAKNNTEGDMGLEVMFAYRNHAILIHASNANEVRLGLDGWNRKSFDLESLQVDTVIEMINAANKNDSSNNRSNGNFVDFLPTFLVLQKGATERDCHLEPDILSTTPRYDEWCISELQKGEARNIPDKDSIDWLLLNGPAASFDASSDPKTLKNLWDTLSAVNLSGVFIHIELSPQDYKD